MKFSSALQALFVCLLVPHGASAQQFPTRPVTIIAPTNAGAGPDFLARQLSQRLQERWGQTVTVINRPGAGSVIGIAEAARAAPDGHTLVVATDAFANNAAIIKLPYDPLTDLQPVSQIAIGGMILCVHPSLPVKTLPEFIDYVRRNPGKLTYGSAGIGTTHHMMMAVFAHTAGLNMVHAPYGGGPGKMQTDLISGRLETSFVAANAAKQFVESGQLRAIAVATGKRMSYWPEVPTFAEQGFEKFDLELWYGLLAPGATPRAITEKIAADVAWALSLPESKASLNKFGMEAAPTSVDAFTRFVHGEIAQKKKVVETVGIKAE
jgi:tripartite-type tricarboxylate transporter receptor subunit TctC